MDDIKKKSFHEMCDFVKKLSYKRNVNKKDIFCVLNDLGGTCSTKHAYLKYIADKQNIPNVQLMLGIFNMNKENTPKIANLLDKYGLQEMPEAHNYLKIDGEIKDFTRTNSKPEDFVNELLEEIEIFPHQITEFKVKYHQNFLKNYLSNYSEISYSLEEFWTIREECISELQY